MLISLLFSNPLFFLVLTGGLLVAFVLHELAHALAADKLGDPTPRLDGRITLNPAAHLDPLGTVALFLVGFGWGKPVMFDPYNLRHPLRDAGLIAAAGPLTNLGLAVIGGFLLVLLGQSNWAGSVLLPFVMINTTLALFNLIPIFPLDGEKILMALLPKTTALSFQENISRYGQFVLIMLVLPLMNGRSVISIFLSPATLWVTQLILSSVQILLSIIGL